MTYVVLARKWRPHRFDDVVGQEHITRTLANAIEQGRVAHGYLFCGPRGVGKTTTARILAKALNCESGPTPTPCNTCPACLDVDLGRSMDIIEVDGASTRGIDDVRELRENVRYAPTSGRTKVYIIDEVHMLTREAFNALLKTLEEPPPHVVFVLATTEPFKVPATILSRCQRFDFARIHPKAVVAQLTKILAAEGVEADPDALALLARRSEGGMRDALSTLDQVLASETGRVTVEKVVRVLGILDIDFYHRLTDALIDGDCALALRQLDAVYHEGADLGELAEELARHLRALMILTVGAGMESVLEELGPQEVEKLKTQAARISPLAAARLVDAALRTLGQAKRSEQVRLHLEIALVEMAGIARAIPLAEVVRRLEEMEKRLGGEGGAPAAIAPTAPPAPAAGPPKHVPGSAAPAEPPPPARAKVEKAAPAAPRRTSAEVLNSPAAAARPPKAPVEPSVAPAVAPDASERAEPAGDVSAEPALEAVELTMPVEELWNRVLGLLKSRRPALWGFVSASRAEGPDAQGRLVIRLDSAHEYARTSLEEKENRTVIESMLAEAAGCRLQFRVESGDGGVAAGRNPETPAARRRPAYEVAREDAGATRVIELFDGEILP